MNTAKYLLAKYIPDLQRMEPRNVGVIVWSPAGVEARFLAEKTDHPGEVDGRSIPPFVTSPSAYKQWVRFWRTELGKGEIAPATGGNRVPRCSAEFLTALQVANKGNFVLTEGGFLLDRVEPEELPSLADHLFLMLVDISVPEEPRDATLDEVCDRLIEETRLGEDPHFHSRHEVVCRVAADAEERYEFSHAYQNGKLQRLYQRVPLSRRKTVLRKTVHDAAWMFEKVIAARVIERDQGAVLVYATDEQRAEPEIDRSLRVLGSVTRVLNVSDGDSVRREFQSLARAAD